MAGQSRSVESSSEFPPLGYTDAPPLDSNLIIGLLQLCFWLFFHPSAWRAFLSRIDPALQPDVNLIQLNRAQWGHRPLQRVLVGGYVILPILASLPTGLLLWSRGAPLDQTIVVPVIFNLAINLALGLMIGSVISVAAGIVGGAFIGPAFGVVATLSTGYVGEALVVPTTVSLAVGIVGSVIGTMADSAATRANPEKSSPRLKTPPTLWTQVGSIIVGIVIGVGLVALVRLGLTTLAGLATGVAENSGYWLARTLVVGGSFGLAAGWRRGVGAGLSGGGLAGLGYGLAVAGIETQFFGSAGFWVESGLAIGLASGLLFGISFGVTVVLPYVLAEHLAGAWAGAWAGALGSAGRHIIRNEAPLWPTLPLGFVGVVLGMTRTWWQSLLLYPFLAAWNLSLFYLDKRRPADRPTLLRFHSAFWDEHQRLPLAGLDEHLLLTLERNPAEGQRALAYLYPGRQRWAAQSVQIELEARRLEQGEDVEELGQAHRRLAAGELAGPASALLRSFNHLSQDIEAALNQRTRYHQRLALKLVDDHLNSLSRDLMASAAPYAARFYPIALTWQQLVARQIDRLAKEVEQSREIDNPYVVGLPLTDQQDIFVGRSDIVSRIEQLLLPQRRAPLLLYGQRRMGKTSLLRNLGRLLPRTVVPLFIDGQRIALAGDEADLLYNLARAMIRSAEQQRGLRLPSLDRPGLAARPFSQFNDWLDEVERRLETEGYNTALLALDEFEMLDQALAKGRFDQTDLLSTLRHLIQHRPVFTVLLASSHPLETFQRWAGFLINVQVVKIGYLAIADVFHLVEQPIKDFPLRYRPEAGRRVLALTRGHPALVQLLCYELVALKNEQEPPARYLVEPADVAAAVPRALESGSFFFTDIERNQVDGPGRAVLAALAGYGEGGVAGRDRLASDCPDIRPEDLDGTLHLLLQRDLIEPCGEGYRFQVALIRRWFERQRGVRQPIF